MKTNIVIMLPKKCDDCSDIITSLQIKIVNYFGTKFATANSEYPTVEVTCSVTEEDIDEISKNVSPNVQFTAIVGADESSRVQGNFIYLD